MSCGSCSFTNVLLIDDDDFYEEGSSFDGFDSVLDCKIDTVSGISNSGNGWMKIYCYDTSQTHDHTASPSNNPTSVPSLSSTLTSPFPTPSSTDTPTKPPLVAQLISN